MAPALTETTTGQSQKFALTMSPPIPGLAKIALTHTPSTSYLAEEEIEEEKHSEVTTTTNNNNNNLQNIIEIGGSAALTSSLTAAAAARKRGDDLTARRRNVNGRGYSSCPSSRKRANNINGVNSSNSVILKYEVGYQIKTKVNGKKDEESSSSVLLTVGKERAIEVSRTMNGKTDQQDKKRLDQQQQKIQHKKMGSLKNNTAGLAVVDTNGNEGDLKRKEEVSGSELVISDENNRESERLKNHAPKMEAEVSGPGPPAGLPGSPQSRETASLARIKLIAEKTETRVKFQNNLERRSENLLRRILKLQTNNSAHHVSRQMMDFVGTQRRSLQMPAKNDKTSLLRLKLMSASSTTSSAFPSSSSSSSLLDMKERFLQKEDVKGLSTAALVDLVKKYGNNNLGGGADGRLGGNNAQTNSCSRKYGGASVGMAMGNSSKSNTTLLQVNNNVVNNADNVAAALVPVPVKLETKVCEDIEWTCGNLMSNLHELEKAVDSDATASSSGGESCDEMDEIEEKRSKNIPFYKRAAWKWAVDRAGVICRWSWLQSQVSDLEIRIRQAGEVYRQLKSMRDPPLDEALIEQLASSDESEAEDLTMIASSPVKRPLPPLLPPNASDAEMRRKKSGTLTSRTCPARVIRKRKLVKTLDLPQMSKKAARLCTIQCNCTGYSRICNVCCGRVNHVQPINSENLDLRDRMGLMDPSFHPVLSFKQDIPLVYHFESILSGSDHGKFTGKQRKSRSAPQMNDHARKQCRKLKKNATATLTARFRKKINNKQVAANRRRNSGHSRLRKSLNSKDDRQRNASESSGLSSKAGSPVPSPGGIDNSMSQDKGQKGNMFHELMKRKRGESAFDIDNIVIPYSMAASTRVERLQYKEIITPKWRLVEDEILKDPFVVNNANNEENLEEDVSDDICVRRHDKCEQCEKKRFMNYKVNPLVGRRTRHTRSDSRADSSGANTPDPLSPHMAEHHDFSHITPPSTPSLVVTSCEEGHGLGGGGGGAMAGGSLSSRRRTTSLSKRDRVSEDFRVPTPDIFMEPVAPWDLRTFPLNDDVYEIMVQESVYHESTSGPEDSLIGSEQQNEDNNEEAGFKSEWNETMDVSSALETEAVPPPPPTPTAEPLHDDPDWVPTNKTGDGGADVKSSPRSHSVVLKLAKSSPLRIRIPGEWSLESAEEKSLANKMPQKITFSRIVETRD